MHPSVELSPHLPCRLPLLPQLFPRDFVFLRRKALPRPAPRRHSLRLGARSHPHLSFTERGVWVRGEAEGFIAVKRQL